MFQPKNEKYVCVEECSEEFAKLGSSKYCACRDPETAYLFSGKCVNACPEGYVVTGDRTCAPCPGVVLHNQCFDSCPDGLFADLDVHTCATVCPHYHLNGVCVNICPSGFAVYDSAKCVAKCPGELLKVDGECKKCEDYVWNA